MPQRGAPCNLEELIPLGRALVKPRRAGTSGREIKEKGDQYENSEEWITNNFESLVSKYGGKYIGVVNDQVVSSALTLKEVLNDAKKLGKEEEEVSLLKVPTEEELACIL